MATYTIAHTKKDALPYLVKGLEDSMKRMRQGRSAQQMKASFGVMGTVTVREVTYGANGWHPHMHQLIFLKSEVDTETFGEVLYEKWQRATQREGLTMNEHGFSLTSTYSRVENYIAKFGIESDQSWTVADELTMGQSGKQPRSDRGVTPFGMLDLVAAGQDEYATLFREYATWYKGKRQLVWSKGLKAALLGDEEELTDHEIAEMEPEIEEAEGLPLVFICLSRAQWHFIIINDLRGEILEQARRGDLESMKEFLAMISGPLDKSQLIA